MTQTGHYNLKKPSDDESADISVLNANTDAIDQELYSQSQKLDAAICGVTLLENALTFTRTGGSNPITVNLSGVSGGSDSGGGSSGSGDSGGSGGGTTWGALFGLS